MTTPTCSYCERPLSDPRGCEGADHDEPMPVPYGAESEAFASLWFVGGDALGRLLESDTCPDCGSPKGALHHVGCMHAECATCHGQFILCCGVDCDSARAWATGGTPHAA